MRILEKEVMMSEQEVIAYDLLVKKYLQILHSGFVETVINMSPAKGRFLDVGTGTGWIGIGISKYNRDAEVIGVDLSETMLKVATRNAAVENVQNIKFRKGDAKRLPFDDESFDSVFCHNMLHHIPEPVKMVKEMMRVLKKDGTLVIRDLKRHSKFITALHVNILGLTYTKLMKKEYRDSILAALSSDEWKNLCSSLDLKGTRLTKQFITHMSIEKVSSRKRSDYIEVPVPFFLKPFKNFYVSCP